MNKILFLFVFLLSACAMKHQTLGPEIQAPELSETGFVSADGKSHAVTVWAPEAEPFAIILALHGFNDYRNAFDLPGQYWAENGILTIAFDQRGFGEDERAGFWAKREALKTDVVQVLGLIREKHPDIPAFVLGESMGGAVALYAMAGRDDAEGLILVAPAVWGWRPVNIVYRPALWAATRVMPGKTFSGKNLDLQPSDNIEMLRALGRDPLIIKRTRLDAIYGLSRLMKWGMKSAPDIRIPVYLGYGVNEHLVPDKNLEKLWQKLPGKLKTRTIFEDGYHQLLRDCDAEKAWLDILEFVAQKTGRQIKPEPNKGSLCEDEE